jgi:hypothetical protein
MAKQEVWQARVAEWRQSGQSARQFCLEKGYSFFSLKDWSSRLGREEPVRAEPRRAEPPRPRRSDSGSGLLIGDEGISAAKVVKKPERTEEIRLARVVREPESCSETPILIEMGGARISVRRGFDEATLQRVVKACGGGQ